MVVLVSKINCGPSVGCEELYPTPKLSSKVELLSSSKHSMVEVQEAATTREKGLEPAEVHEIYLCTDRAATDTVAIRTVTVAGMRIADECHRDDVENPAHREGRAIVDEPFVAALELITSRTHSARKCMSVFKGSVEPICVLAVRTLWFLCDCRCGEKQGNDNRGG